MTCSALPHPDILPLTPGATPLLTSIQVAGRGLTPQGRPAFLFVFGRRGDAKVRRNAGSELRYDTEANAAEYRYRNSFADTMTAATLCRTMSQCASYNSDTSMSQMPQLSDTTNLIADRNGMTSQLRAAPRTSTPQLRRLSRSCAHVQLQRPPHRCCYTLRKDCIQDSDITQIRTLHDLQGTQIREPSPQIRTSCNLRYEVHPQA